MQNLGSPLRARRLNGELLGSRRFRGSHETPIVNFLESSPTLEKPRGGGFDSHRAHLWNAIKSSIYLIPNHIKRMNVPSAMDWDIQFQRKMGIKQKDVNTVKVKDMSIEERMEDEIDMERELYKFHHECFVRKKN